jgi:hypothetical protein
MTSLARLCSRDLSVAGSCTGRSAPVSFERLNACTYVAASEGLHRIVFDGDSHALLTLDLLLNRRVDF